MNPINPDDSVRDDGADITPDNTVFVDTLFGARTRRGLVSLQIGEKSEPVKISPTDARSVALSLLEAAEAAETDELLWTFFEKEMNLPFEALVDLLRSFRLHREKRREEAEK